MTTNPNKIDSQPTPADIEAFAKGLEMGLVPSGWVEYAPRRFHRFVAYSEWVHPTGPTDLDIEAMEGKAGRVLRDAEHAIEWCKQANEWCLCYRGAVRETLPGTKHEHLPALIAAVERIQE